MLKILYRYLLAIVVIMAVTVGAQAQNSYDMMGQTVTDTSGYIYDSGGPTGDYTNNEVNLFVINVGAGKTLTLQWQFFDVETNEAGLPQACIYDYVEVFDGDTTATSGALYCGTSLPPNFIAASGKLSIRFKSDGAGTRPGFKGFWTTASTLPTFTQSYCGAYGEDCSSADVNPIVKVTIQGGIDNSSGCDNGGYGDYTNMLAAMEPGGVYQASVSANPNGFTATAVGIWIDWNDNKSFDDVGENVMKGSCTQCGLGVPFDGTITCPPGTALGPKRMRVRSTSWTGAIFPPPPSPDPAPCNFQTGGEVEDYTIDVGGVPATPTAYCDAKGTNCATSADYGNAISDVQLQGEAQNISNTTSLCSPSGYEDYTNMSADMQVGSQYQLDVLTNDSLYFGGLISAWIDWNNDFDFDDANELIGSGSTFGTIATPFTILIMPPAGTIAGDKRLRIRTSVSEQPAPCGYQSPGEVEDYTIKVLCTLSASASGTSPVCQGATAVLTVDSLPSGGSIQWQDSSAGAWTNISGATTNPYTTTVLSTTKYFRAAVSTLSCGVYTKTITVVVNSAPTVVVTPSNAAICPGASAQLTASGAGTYTWSPATGLNNAGIANPVASPTASTTYIVVGTGANACTASAQTIVIIKDGGRSGVLTASPTMICPGGSSTVMTKGSTGTLTWEQGPSFNGPWSAPSTLTKVNDSTYTATPTTTIVYRVVANKNSCTQSTAAEVKVGNNPAKPLVASSSTVICNGQPVILRTSNYTSGVSWNDVNNTQNDTLIVSSAGTYIATATSGGCQSSSDPVVITNGSNPTKPQIQLIGNNPACSGQSVQLKSSITGNNTWSTGATTDAITVTAAGTYTVVQTSATGCKLSSDPYVMNFNASPAKPQVVASAMAICNGKSAVLHTSNYTTGIKWNDANNTQNDTLIVTSAGTYVATATANGCSTASDPIVISTGTNPPQPQIQLIGNNPECSGTAVQLKSSITGNNNWNTGATTDAITVTSSGTYVVTQVATSGCSTESVPYVMTFKAAPAKPMISASAMAVCSGKAVTLRTTNHGSGITWNDANNTQNDTLIVTAAGTYIATVTVNGCSSISDPVAIGTGSTPAQPQIQLIGNNPACSGQSVQLVSSISGNNTWSTGAATDMITVTASGTYIVTQYNAQGCTNASAPFVMTFKASPAKPIISASAMAVCSGKAAVLHTTNFTTGITWNDASNTQNDTLKVTSAGTYIASASANGCTTSSDPIVITTSTTPPQPQIQLTGNNPECSGQSVQLKSSITGNNTWNTGATSDAITVTISGTYIVTQSNAQGCTNASAPLVMNFKPLPPTPTVVLVTQGPICQGKSARLASTNKGGNVWSNNQITDTITVTASGSYTVSTNLNGCKSTSAVFNLNFDAVPATPTITQSGSDLNASGSAASYQWYDANGPINGATSATYRPTANGMYRVVAKSAQGCESVQSAAFNYTSVGIATLGKEPFRLYPNPSTEQFVVKIPQGVVSAKLIICDLSGREVSVIKLREGSNVINSKLAAGAYIAKYYNANEIKHIQRLVIQ